MLQRQWTGLTAQEVAERVKRGETNDFKTQAGRTYVQILRDNVFNLFNIVLFTLLVIVAFFGDLGTVFFSGFSVFTNMVLGLVQEINAKRKLNRMALLAITRVNVWRDGRIEHLPMTEVVLDDLIALEPGDRLVVDGEIVHSDSLELDESQLTGESDAVYKNPGDPVYSGSFCIAGSGIMVTRKVGKDSTLNKISAMAREYHNALTPTQQKLAAIVQISILVMFVFAPLLLINSYRLDDTALGTVRNEVVFVTSLVPQGLVLTATVSLTIGAIKISRHQTLIQRLNAIESMANVTVLCFDKTGTLTKNRLTVTEVLPLNGRSPDDITRELYQYVHNLSYRNRTAGAIDHYLDREQVSLTLVPKQNEIPFSSGRKWGAVELRDRTLVLGAPERILPAGAGLDQADELSVRGLRVLAFAEAVRPLNGDGVIADACEPIGLIVMSDQIREDIQTTLDDFTRLNVRLKVISGDNLETVRSIASGSGIDVREAYTGDQLEAMADSEFERAVKRGNVFARIEPHTKRRIVEALKAQGEYVAMVGDGVNDVPALKAANLAIVMNDGTQISKDVADIVLLNNAMSTLPLAFREGREITQTIFGTTKMFLAKNAYNFIMFLLVGFMALPFMITPAQISIAAFGTVNMPATFIALNIVRPRYISRFRRDVIDYILTVGLVAGMGNALLYAVIYFATNDLFVARSMITVVISLLGMMIVWNVQGVELHEARSFVRHWLVIAISGTATLLTLLAFYATPATFEFKAPDPGTQGGMLIILLTTFAFLLMAMLVSVGTRKRGLIDAFWSFGKDD